MSEREIDNRSGVSIRDALNTRVLCLDGAMGTALQQRHLTAEDFGGEAFEGCNEHLVLTRPDVISDIHRAYLQAGADIVETNTFGSTDLVLAEYPPLQEKAKEITRVAAQLARAAADAFSTPDKPRFVAGSMGPTTKAISVTGGVTFDRLVETFSTQAEMLMRGGADYLLLETCQDTRNIKAGLIGIDQAFERLGRDVPVAVSGTIEPMGTMLGGQTAEALVVSLQNRDLLYVGLNCATGPEFMADHIRAMSDLARCPIGCVPNAGLPDENGHYLETPAMMRQVLEHFMQQGWINLVGGCCGTDARTIATFAEMIQGKEPRHVRRNGSVSTWVSGLEALEINDDNRPILVGERTNSLGSKKFKDLIAEEKYEEAAEIGRRQVKNGAHVIDVCLQNTDRDEARDTREFLEKIIRMVKVPLMIDSTDHRVIEEALTYSQGKAIINSINLEDGLDRYEKVVPLANRFGASLVVGCIDENKQQGMAVTRERKLEIAERSYKILTEDFGVDPNDIIFDPLVFPCASGDANYIGSANETVEGIRLIKEAMPECKTILGISNVSFGLPSSGREVVNSVFLYHCTKAGLDMAIVNSEKLERYASIPEEEKKLAEDVLFHTTDEAVAKFADHFRGQSSRSKKDVSTLSLDERLANYIVQGTKDGLAADLDLKLKEAQPLDIINGPLMRGMDEVGRLFNNNELIVAEVLQSAEAMKAAVAHLEPHMDKAMSSAQMKGKIVLATVKGDVHDIGKNLVEIVLSNNGYNVINLGIKVPPHDLVEAIKTHQPDMIGLSGLLVKSALQMVITAEELSLHQNCPPMLVGGAALTRNFTRKKIAPKYQGITVYAKDAMDGLDLANKLMNVDTRESMRAQLEEETKKLLAIEEQSSDESAAAPKGRSQYISILPSIPSPKDFDRHLMSQMPLDEIWSYINPKMLYGKHLGLKGPITDLIAAVETNKAQSLNPQAVEKTRELSELIANLKKESRPGGAHPISVRGVWQFFKASSDNETLRLHASDGNSVLCEWAFPRQKQGEHLCVADYVRPLSKDGIAEDSVALFVVTAGENVRTAYEKYKAEGQFLKSHAIQALALETAEAAAEWLHKRLRGQWGIVDAPNLAMMDLFQAHYQGKRYSFGYPACPDLAMQKPLFDLLNPSEIGVALTEGYMMEPEASVSAIVVHHPDAKYFSVGKEQL